MSEFTLDLPSEVQELPKNNLSSDYLPIRNEGKHNHFCWGNVESLFLSYALNKKVDNYTFNEFKQSCKNELQNKLSDSDFWPVLEEMYFNNYDILNTAPEFLLFNIENTDKLEFTSADKRIAQLLFELLEPNFYKHHKISTELNFLEREFFDIFKEHLSSSNPKRLNEPYLPFLSCAFSSDVKFMFKHPKFMQAELKNMLAFYIFSYCSQLALNIQEWKNGSPEPKPLFFILDNEKASKERSSIIYSGFSSIDIAYKYVFPILTMAENLQPSDQQTKLPFWKIANYVIESENQKKLKLELKTFANLQKNKKELSTHLPGDASPVEWLNCLMQMTKDEFWNEDKALKGGMANKYRNQIKNQFGQNSFFRPRGRSGNVLELNQDTILLLTNLAIGDEPKLRFGKLIKKFNIRGVFFDELSEQELIKFYERIGIVERMSDSGEAINVRKTI